jgi:hypothetical protein
MAEGRVTFTDSDPAPLTRSILAKDRGEQYADEWSAGAPPANVMVAELVPHRLSGYEFDDSLDTRRPQRHICSATFGALHATDGWLW